MQTQSAFFDDLAKVMIGMVGAAQGATEEAKSFLRSQADRIAVEMDFVRRDEFEAMAQLARTAMERVEALEAELAARNNMRANPAASPAVGHSPVDDHGSAA